ncbi:MAG: hypothetical protein LAN36_15635 [Acidobacteriia bacterium]|nr:hypothetical protein [Terriglobia bacterium]
MGDTRPPLEYLLASSQMGLESVELARLNRAANLRKEAQQVLEKWIDAEVDARIARSILEWKRADSPCGDERSGQASLGEPQQFAISFLPSLMEPAASSDRAAHPALPAPDQAGGRATPPIDARTHATPRGFSSANTGLLRDRSTAECVRTERDRDASVPGLPSLRRAKLVKSPDLALRHAEHVFCDRGKVLYSSFDGGANNECSLRLPPSAVRPARRATSMPGRDLRPLAPARRLLRCALAADRHAAAAS